MKKLIEKLKCQVKEIKNTDIVMDDASWKRQNGVIISGNEAELIITTLESILKQEPDKELSAEETEIQLWDIMSILSANKDGHITGTNEVVNKIKELYASQHKEQPNNADSETALNIYAKKCKEDFTKPSGIAQGWRACYEWLR